MIDLDLEPLAEGVWRWVIPPDTVEAGDVLTIRVPLDTGVPPDVTLTHPAPGGTR